MRFSLLSFLLFCALLAQGQAVFVASADAKKVETGYMVSISYTLENADARDMRPPSFDGFKLHSGPNRSFSTTVVNGKVSQKQIWLYTLIALEPGVRIIGPATAETKTGQLQSNSLTITITAPSVATGTVQQLAARGTAVFIQSRLTDDTVYVGQTVRLEDILYSRVPVESYQLINTPDYKELFARDLRRTDHRSGQKTLGKYQYSTSTLKATALVGQQPGEYALAPNSYQLGILSDEKPQRDPFGRPLGRNFKPETVRSTGTSLTVRPLPEPPASGFCGLVGSYELAAETDKTSITTDDAFLITLRITGDGDPKMMQTPVLVVPQGLEAYPAKVVSEEVWEADNQGYFHETVLEYYMVPQTVGQYTILPEIVVFDPESDSYKGIKAQSISINVAKGTGVKPQAGSAEKRIIKTSPHTRTALIWLTVFTLIGGALWLLARRKPKKETTPDWTKELKTTSVEPEPEPMVVTPTPPAPDTSEPLPDIHSNAVSFYSSVEKYVLQQLKMSDNYTAKNWLASRSSVDALRLSDILDLCERVKYAGAQPNIPHEEVLAEVTEALSKLATNN